MDRLGQAGQVVAVIAHEDVDADLERPLHGGQALGPAEDREERPAVDPDRGPTNLGPRIGTERPDGTLGGPGEESARDGQCDDPAH